MKLITAPCFVLVLLCFFDGSTGAAGDEGRVLKKPALLMQRG